MTIRYETEDVVSALESGENRGATALDPDAVERARPRQRQSRQSGFPIDPGRGPSGFPIDPARVPSYGSGHGSSPLLRRSSQLPAEPRRSSQLPAEPRRSSQLPADSLAGSTQPSQRARGKRQRIGREQDPHHTRTFGPAEPLPPSPASATETTDGWFEPALRTEAIPDLIGLVGDTSRSYEQSAAHHLGVVEEAQADAPLPARAPLLDLHARPWLFPVLLGTTCLTVGMVLGALLFGAHSAAPEKSEREQVIIRCSDPPER